ncbi:MAG: hypothetical protein COA33_004940 [Fluviicola sp.]|nr:hypothetical protein [Fluviicola sp.]
MKTYFLLILLFFSLQSSAHEYYFAFAEVQYIDSTQKMEVTLSVSTHDLEAVLKKKGVLDSDLESMSNNVTSTIALEKELLEHFKISSSENCQLSLVGSKTLLTGVTNFYFESEPFAVENELTFFFDLLMGTYPEQQNKITLYMRGSSYTQPFLQNIRTQIIKLENK